MSPDSTMNLLIGRRAAVSALLTAGALALLVSGCSRQARTTRHLEAAGRDFDSGQYDQAEIEYLNVLQAQPRNPQAISRLAEIYFAEGRLGRVYPFLVKACELEPDNLDLRLKLGQLYQRVGKITEARAAAFFVLDRRPGDADAPLLLAEAIGGTADVEDTRQRLQKLPAAIQESAPVLVALGALQMREHQAKEAEALFLRAQAADPKSAAAQSALGGLYWAQGDLPRAEKALAAATGLSSLRSARRLQYAQFEIQTGHPEAGRPILEEITQKAPDFIPAWLMLAQLAADEKKYPESTAFNARVLARDSTNPEALLLGGRLLLETGQTAKAVTELERILKLFPKLPAAHYQLGLAYLAGGEIDKAAASLKQALALAPDFPDATLLLATINLRRGDPGAAIVRLKPVVNGHPTNHRASLLLADAYRAGGDFAEAIAVCRRLAKASPGDPQVFWLIGFSYAQQKRTDEARQAFTQALGLSPDFLPALAQLVEFDLAARDFADATRRIESGLAKSPKQAGLHLLQARVELARQDPKAAEASLRQAIKLQPDSPTAYFMLAKLYLSSNRRQEALANLQEAAAKDPKDVEALMLIAEIQEQQKDFAAARDAYEKVVAINPRFNPALNNLAYLYSQHLGDPEKAFQMAQKARELLPHEPHVADTLGWILYQRRQYPWALSLLGDSAEKLPESAEVQYHLGAAHYMLGEETPARLALQRAVQLGGDSDWMDRARQDLAVLAIDASYPGDGAQTLLEKAVADQKDDPVALVRLGAIYEKQGAADKALSAYQDAVQASPKDVRALLSLAALDETRGDTAKALELAKTARQLAPDDPEVAQVLGRLAFASGNYSWAATLLRESARGRPDDPELLYDLAQASYNVGRVDDAEAAMRQALQKAPGFPRAELARRFLRLTALAAKPADAVAAAAEVDEILKTSPADGPALMARAAIDEQHLDLGAAEQAYEKVLSRYPDFAPAMRRLAILYAGQKTTSRRAAELAVKAQAAYPSDPELARAFGIAEYQQGDYARAETLLKESAARQGDDAELKFYLGMAQHQLNETAECRRTLQRALDLHLPTDLAAEARRVLAEAK